MHSDITARQIIDKSRGFVFVEANRISALEFFADGRDYDSERFRCLALLANEFSNIRSVRSNREHRTIVRPHRVKGYRLRVFNKGAYDSQEQAFDRNIALVWHTT